MEEASVFSAGVQPARSHYPANINPADVAPYREVINASPQGHRSALKFGYEISFERELWHYNPPIWQKSHPHTFGFSVLLMSPVRTGDLYGVDMIEAEQTLKNLILAQPETVNNWERCLNGTTEQMCLWLADEYMLALPDPEIKLVSVSVSETKERVTHLSIQ